MSYSNANMLYSGLFVMLSSMIAVQSVTDRLCVSGTVQPGQDRTRLQLISGQYQYGGVDDDGNDYWYTDLGEECEVDCSYKCEQDRYYILKQGDKWQLDPNWNGWNWGGQCTEDVESPELCPSWSSEHHTVSVTEGLCPSVPCDTIKIEGTHILADNSEPEFDGVFYKEADNIYAKIVNKIIENEVYPWKYYWYYNPKLMSWKTTAISVRYNAGFIPDINFCNAGWLCATFGNGLLPNNDNGHLPINLVEGSCAECPYSADSPCEAFLTECDGNSYL